MIASPRSDVCERCEDLRCDVVRAASDIDKLTATTKFTEHVHAAQRERE